MIIDWNTKVPLDKEFFRSAEQKQPLEGVTSTTRKGKKHYADLAIKVCHRFAAYEFIIHIEPQAQAVRLKEFPLRMFKYFSRLHEEYKLPVYPIVVFSFAKPLSQQAQSYKVDCAGRDVLAFSYEVIQLNRLSWKDYCLSTNPVAIALMAKMDIATCDRPVVKFRCLEMLQPLQLNAEERELVAEFVDAYLYFVRGSNEQIEFEKLLKEAGYSGKDEVGKMVTSWKREGIEEGLEEGLKEGLEKGRQEGMLRIVTKQLNLRLRSIDDSLQAQINQLDAEQLEALSQSLLNFTTVEDLKNWLLKNNPVD